MKVLGIETSCDDTSVAIVDERGWVLSMCSSSQDIEHEPYGGIVPEIASRNHSANLLPLIIECLKQGKLDWSDIDGIAVTNRPGLVGALIVGLVTAKTLAHSYNKKLIGINHLEGHLLAPFLRDQSYQPPDDFIYPYLGLAISGGHTSLYLIEGLGQYTVLGTTKDDAAGEAFDKFAKLVGLGFPGGQRVDALSKNGDVKKYEFPRSMINEDNLDMSFSGLKSSAQRLVQQLSPEEIQLCKQDLCASYQEAIVDVLVAKLDSAATKYSMKKIILTGGVSANSRLRHRAQEWANRKGKTLIIPPIRYCTDNGAMIAYAGLLYLQNGIESGLNLGPSPQTFDSDFRNS